jgi:hypothetical protein
MSVGDLTLYALKESKARRASGSKEAGGPKRNWD